MQRTIALITQQLSIVLSQYMIRLPDESSRMAKRNMNRHECFLVKAKIYVNTGDQVGAPSKVCVSLEAPPSGASR
jgi:hypothetical protein